MIEVEVRGGIELENFEKLLKEFKEKAEFVKEKDRLTFIYFRERKNISDVTETQEDPVDLKIRITNKKAEMVMKYGRWGATESRKEILLPIASEQIEDAIDFLKYLGWDNGVLMDTKTYVFNYKDAEFAFVRSGDTCYFEAEKLCEDESQSEKIIKELESLCEELNLKLFDDKGLINLVNGMNQREDRLFDFEKQTFNEIKENFKEFF